jgi:uncharacterized membrane protein
LTGGLEILGGLGLLVPKTRRTAAWGLVALLIAVFPANVYNRSRCDRHCAGPQVGPPARATAPSVVATLEYKASFIVPLNAAGTNGSQPDTGIPGEALNA